MIAVDATCRTEALAATLDAAIRRAPPVDVRMICPSPWMAFYLIVDAQAHRNQYGGWIFLPAGGERHPIWFNTEFTPSVIFTHPLTAGMSGRLL